MKTVVGGLIAIVLGIFCLTLFFTAFLNFMAGTLPILFLIGGCLTLYLKREEDSDTWSKSDITETSFPTAPAQEGPAETKPTETEPTETESVETESVVTEPVEKATEDLGREILQLFGNTDSLVFHSPDCKFSKSKKCTAVFNTRETAIQEGYKPCKACSP